MCKTSVAQPAWPKVRCHLTPKCPFWDDLERGVSGKELTAELHSGLQGRGRYLRAGLATLQDAGG